MSVTEYFERFEEWRSDLLIVKLDLNESYLVDKFNLALNQKIQLKLGGFHKPPQILFEAILHAKIEEAVMEMEGTTMECECMECDIEVAEAKDDVVQKIGELMENEEAVSTNGSFGQKVAEVFDNILDKETMEENLKQLAK
ncbi:hypothetical protein ACH5RR_039087 [Cinchona calisaya]|uniref:Uncharacterized protein n=1 Tax=Cinchona calisaya TaxID=153742 RepID=A0ABD2XX86_9GENT